MGMMLRRHTRKPDSAPTVNGKPVNKEPKNRSLTENTEKVTTTQPSPAYTR